MTTFKPIFAILVLLIATQIAWQLFPRKQKSTAQSERAAHNFEHLIEHNGDPCTIGVSHKRISIKKIHFTFGDEDFVFSPWLPFFAGMGIAVFSSAFGVGGGFLLVPFMSIIMRLPMFIIAATSALAIAIHSITSISNYIHLGVELDFPLLGLLIAGTVIGSFFGPYLSKFLPESWLRGSLCLILIVIGLRYLGVL